MFEAEGSTAVLDRERTRVAQDQLTIHVSRYGEYGQKALRFTVQDFNIVQPMHVYNIAHVINLERMVDSVAIYNGSGDVFVTLHHWQLITEDLAVALAKSIGNALGFVPGAVVVTLGQLT